ncbi:hypothetical protein KC19_2G121900 [Ceratodon purpureus]|uniref:Uncharacterized protein n=1 Tax=Ceratodon purpureus TaxID=3225 RepID=A0A8T0IUR5_CERPU|nr:hypothetical protein KC19_2G121900 [Ceratodon purpureus]
MDRENGPWLWRHACPLQSTLSESPRQQVSCQIPLHSANVTAVNETQLGSLACMPQDSGVRAIAKALNPSKAQPDPNQGGGAEGRIHTSGGRGGDRQEGCDTEPAGEVR